VNTRCQVGDIARITASSATEIDIEGMIVTVEESVGECDLYTSGAHWYVYSSRGVLCNSGHIQNKFVWADKWLVPIAGPRFGDETPIETNAPEALRLALGIESRSYA
jgi:hypothetical protein